MTFIQQNKIQFYWVCLGNLPIMTKRGHFIINGSPRILVNQLIRAEGIYYKQQIHKNLNPQTAKSGKYYRTFYLDIIAKRGVWLRFEMDKRRQIWICMKQTPKIPIALFLKTIGLTFKKLQNLIPFPIVFNSVDRNLEMLSNSSQMKSEIVFNVVDENAQMVYNSVNTNLILQKFLNIHNYDLGSIGRQNLNSKLGLKTQKTTLTPIDFLKITLYLIQVSKQKKQFDDIDDLQNRRIRSIGELLQVQIHQSLFRLHNLLTEKNKKVNSLPYLFTTKPINSVLREFFGSCALSQFLDQVNPLAELTHKRRISAMGPNGIKKETAGMDIRSIHSTYFGRICPIETPEGQNAGLVNSLTIFTLPNKNGFLESFFYQIYKGQIQNQFRPTALTAFKEKKCSILAADISKSNLHFVKQKIAVVRFNQNLIRQNKSKTHYQSYSTYNLISIATSIIPFMEHNDANRVLMGSNMQRQSIPLLSPQASYIFNSFENRVISDCGLNLQTHSSGIILTCDKNCISIYSTSQPVLSAGLDFQKYLFLSKQVSDTSVQIHSFFYSCNKFNCVLFQFYKKLPIQQTQNLILYKQNFDFWNTYLSSRFEIKKCAQSQKQTWQIHTFVLQNYERTNQNTFQIQKPIVQPLQWVQKGDLLVDCSTSDKGRLALGKNLMVAYLPWEGYNFEDAIILNKTILDEQQFTSLHIEKYEIDLKETLKSEHTITAKVPISEKYLSHLDSNGIITIGSFITERTILIGKITPVDTKPLLPHEKLLYDIVGKNIEYTKDTSFRAPANLQGRVIAITLNNHKYNSQSKTIFTNCHIICFYIAKKHQLKIGDKMSGRHGNKGIISQILAPQDLPFLLNGEIVDIVLNPLGVPSRMNVGQLFEALLGLVSSKLKENFKLEIFDEKYGFDASRSLVYLKLFQLRKQMNIKWYFSKQTAGKMFLFDGRTGEKFDLTTTVGNTYILKLIHLVDNKMHARSTGPYSLVTQQPLKGRSKHGGQRFGEMEVWALEGFGSAYILQELLTIKSDDIFGRDKITETILHKSKMDFSTPESFKVLLKELQSLCLNLQVIEKII
uniref:DNA-directed RNA polymerase subunit beta n=1 Tax=Codium arenicola TaxID=1191365 RepID=A0A2P0QHU9_9CHLO|nr:RNA polymerase b-subunit [Codium arenicola]ARO74333.1 RNA polymerase b-subunit [Codium arenicola]